MLNERTRRLLDAYPVIFLACHRRHVRSDETGRQVTEHQASMLDHLNADRPTRISKLAEHLGIGVSATSIMASRLQKAGYVSRVVDREDGRSVGLKLTRAGARIKEQNTVLDPELVDQMFRLMRADEIERALAALETMARYAEILLRRRTRRNGQ